MDHLNFEILKAITTRFQTSFISPVAANDILKIDKKDCDRLMAQKNQCILPSSLAIYI